LGTEESRTKNNHSTWYDAQVVTFALYVDDIALAEKILRQSPQKHIASKIEPDGRQPYELTRTKSFGYSSMNLRGTFVLARLGEHVGLDLWNYQTDDGRSLRKAFEFLIPFADPKNKWPYEQIEHLDPTSLYSMLKLAQIKIHEFDAQPVLKKLPQHIVCRQRAALLYP
jgi:hypothetical protein